VRLSENECVNHIQFLGIYIYIYIYIYINIIYIILYIYIYIKRWIQSDLS